MATILLSTLPFTIMEAEVSSHEDSIASIEISLVPIGKERESYGFFAQSFPSASLGGFQFTPPVDYFGFGATGHQCTKLDD